jgi:hypothetical protein
MNLNQGGDSAVKNDVAFAEAITNDNKAHLLSQRNTQNNQLLMEPSDFAQRLMKVLSTSEYQSALRWMPGGTSFCILNVKQLTEKVLVKHFNGVEYRSFVSLFATMIFVMKCRFFLTYLLLAYSYFSIPAPSRHSLPLTGHLQLRNLELYGFRICTPPIENKGKVPVYYHKLFHRDYPELCKCIVMTKSCRTSSVISDSDGDIEINSQLDLPNISQLYPLLPPCGHPNRFAALQKISEENLAEIKLSTERIAMLEMKMQAMIAYCYEITFGVQPFLNVNLDNDATRGQGHQQVSQCTVSDVVESMR